MRKFLEQDGAVQPVRLCNGLRPSCIPLKRLGRKKKGELNCNKQGKLDLLWSPLTSSAEQQSSGKACMWFYSSSFCLKRKGAKEW